LAEQANASCAASNGFFQAARSLTDHGFHKFIRIASAMSIADFHYSSP
jgi:hypothetical protein